MESPPFSDTERNRRVWVEANAEFFDAKWGSTVGKYDDRLGY